MAGDWRVVEARRKHRVVVLRVAWVHIEGMFDGKHKVLF